MMELNTNIPSEFYFSIYSDNDGDKVQSFQKVLSTLSLNSKIRTNDQSFKRKNEGQRNSAKSIAIFGVKKIEKDRDPEK